MSPRPAKIRSLLRPATTPAITVATITVAATAVAAITVATITVAAIAIAVALVIFRVDLTPRVEADFFFAADDPQLQASKRIAERFPSSPQILISAAGPDLRDPEYLERIRRLTADLGEIAGVVEVRSLTQGPPTPYAVAESPVWSRLLLGSLPTVSQLIVTLDRAEDRAGSGTDDAAVVAAVEGLLARYHAPSFALDASGVPYVMELIRRRLARDLRVFSLSALAVFGLLVAALYRSVRLVAGTLVTCLGACAVTLAVLDLAGSPIGLLSANIVPIVFVLTLSHLVFLTASWRASAPPLPVGGKADVRSGVRAAVARTLPASFWCMVTTLLGFASLRLASAHPLRELGLAGAVGSAVAIAVAYGLYPLFLAGASPRPRSAKARPRRPAGWRPWAVAAIVLMVATAGFGLRRLDTDPTLLDYFAADDPIRSGLELIDRNGGSSPLLVVVRDPGGKRLDSDAVQRRLARLQQQFEDDGDVGVSLSLPVILAEARRVPLSFLLSWSRLLDLVETSDEYRAIVRAFVSEDRREGLFFLRMHETDRSVPRRVVLDRLRALVTREGLTIDEVGGLYDLQERLASLVGSSVLTGLGGLLGLFVLISALVARAWRTTLVMVVSLAALPVLVLGAVGLSGQPLDVISSPAANVAIALGIDSMIHLVSAVRRRAEQGDDDAWETAVADLARPILGATVILAGGFGIFALSSFPPTQRFGLCVAGGTLAAAAMTLVVLPFLARFLARFPGSPERPPASC